MLTCLAKIIVVLLLLFLLILQLTMLYRYSKAGDLNI